MRENEFIQLFAEIHGTAPYSADAEIVKHAGGFDLFSIDGFSETEDLFEHTPPEWIGRNMALAACADLLACGVKPEMLLQAWNIDDRKDKAYYRAIACGVEQVLRHYGAICIGGDTGCSRPWSWTATVKGHSATPPVTRIASRRMPFDLYLSGTLGDANLAAFLQESMPEFELRDPVSAEALFATDTSGGLFDALENFRRVNPGLHLCLSLAETISPTVFERCPKEFDPFWALIGGAGEHELLYAVPQGFPAGGIRIGEGEFADSGGAELLLFAEGKEIGRVRTPPPDFRALPREEWVQATRNYYCELFRP